MQFRADNGLYLTLGQSVRVHIKATLYGQRDSIRAYRAVFAVFDVFFIVTAALFVVPVSRTGTIPGVVCTIGPCCTKFISTIDVELNSLRNVLTVFVLQTQTHREL
jgi:hypothetical protein